MKVSAKADYAVRAATELAATTSDRPMKAERISDAQGIPIKFLEAILLELKHANVVKSTRGADGGYALARPATEISIADVIRAVDGPLANVRGERPEDTRYKGSAENLTKLWVAVRASLRDVLEQTSLADLISGKFPKRVQTLSDAPTAWQSPGRSGAR
jgi:Rrf2 family protein